MREYGAKYTVANGPIRPSCPDRPGDGNMFHADDVIRLNVGDAIRCDCTIRSGDGDALRTNRALCSGTCDRDRATGSICDSAGDTGDGLHTDAIGAKLRACDTVRPDVRDAVCTGTSRAVCIAGAVSASSALFAADSIDLVRENPLRKIGTYVMGVGDPPRELVRLDANNSLRKSSAVRSGASNLFCEWSTICFNADDTIDANIIACSTNDARATRRGDKPIALRAILSPLESNEGMFSNRCPFGGHKSLRRGR